MNKVSWSYLTGFFEADGSIYRASKYWRLNISNYEVDIIDTLHAFLKGNGINAYKYDKTKYGKGHEVRINSQADVKATIKQMLRHSHLGYKRELMLIALQEIK